MTIEKILKKHWPKRYYTPEQTYQQKCKGIDDQRSVDISKTAKAIKSLDRWVSVEEELPKTYANLEICYDGFDALLTKHENQYCFGFYNGSGNFMKEIKTRNLLIEQDVLAWRYHIPFPQEDIKVEVKTLDEFLHPPGGNDG